MTSIEAGSVFYRLTIIKDAGILNKRRHWLCQCSCGSPPKTIGQSNLRSGHTKSCGCLEKENRRRLWASRVTHGSGSRKGKRDRLYYSIWCTMKKRCYNPNHDSYSYYGGRGITVCDEWKNSFELFKIWALNNGYSDTLSIERNDPDGNYEPSNCSWIDLSLQNNNKRNSRFVIIHGEKINVSSASKKFGIVKSGTIISRLNKGWSDEDAVLTPVKRGPNK